jgi:hypothetical protein
MPEQLTEREARRILIEIAQGYDRMAETAQEKTASEYAPE